MTDDRFAAARAAKAEVDARPQVVFECRTGTHGPVTVYVEPDCVRQPAAWCCGKTMKRVRS